MRTSNLLSAFSVFFVGILIITFGSTAQGVVDDCDWNSGDPHKMHWPQEPDLSVSGLDASMSRVTLADDFKCSSSGPIYDIHIWGSFVNDNLPINGPDSLRFKISIYSDIPAIGDRWSMPGDELWSRTFGPGEYSALKVHEGPEGWYDTYWQSYQANNHKEAYQFNFCIADDPFVQEEGTIYWLVIDELKPSNADYVFGWKTTTINLGWNDHAVLRIDGTTDWNSLQYPDEHSYRGRQMDLAFVITGISYALIEYDWGDAPDGAGAPGYPTMSFNNGASHIIKGPWLGDDTDQPDAELNGQPETNALGDDLDVEPLFSLGPPNDDEDGVSIPPMFIGQPADITLQVNGGGGFVDAWVDFNNDMSWDASEKIYSWYLPDGIHVISFNVPGDAVRGPTFARFRISTEGTSYPWGYAKDGEVEDHQVTIDDDCGRCDGQEFIRGDADQDGQVTDADVTFIFNYLLIGGSPPGCMDSADTDDNGVIDMGDATFLLTYVSGNGPPPPAPFPDCGPDPTADALTCLQFDPCPGGTLVTPGNAKWFQLPDVTANGIDIRVDSSDGNVRTIADDFECRNESYLTDIHLWCSWKSDIRGVIKNIHLSIHADDPAGQAGSDPDNQYSKPAPEVLWEMDFIKGRFKESLYYTVPSPGEWWWDPASGEFTEGGDKQIWRIDIDINQDEAFLQQGSKDSPRIYWLEVQIDTEDGELGWKTRRWPDHYMDDAVWDMKTDLPLFWNELRYPKNHPYNGLDQDSIDMAFCLTYTHDEDMSTSRPVSLTQCPVKITKCPMVATRCAREETQCPVVFTQCPPLETHCVAITMCPPTDTSCPVMPTGCPIAVTQCPVYETRCPPEPSKCPPAPTQCTAVDTLCPPVDTQCPERDTYCPESFTQCPPYATFCQDSPTQCPVETICPAATTKCPIVETGCPAPLTQCPLETVCPAATTKCPTDDTMCPYKSTECPPIYTQCPPTLSTCTVGAICPVTTIQPDSVVCPVETFLPGCIITYLPYNAVCLVSEGESQSSPVVRQCPVIEAACPTVISENVQASAM